MARKIQAGERVTFTFWGEVRHGTFKRYETNYGSTCAVIAEDGCHADVETCVDPRCVSTRAVTRRGKLVGAR